MFRGVSKDKIQWLTVKFLEKISGDVVSGVFVDVSKDKNLIYLVELSFKKVISRNTISDMSSDTLTKQVVAIVDCNMMSLAKVRNFCLSRMKGCKSYYILFI